MALTDDEVGRRVREIRRRRQEGAPLPVLLGEAPSKSGDRYWMFPLSGRVAESLCGMAGVSPMVGESRYGQWTWALYECFDCVNLIERWPGVHGKGSAFPLDVARAALVERMPEIVDRVVVMLGARLPRVLCAEGECASFYEWDEVVLTARAPDGEVVATGRSLMAAIPHPSGLNRLYNAPLERQRAGVVLKQAMDLALTLAGEM